MANTQLVERTAPAGALHGINRAVDKAALWGQRLNRPESKWVALLLGSVGSVVVASTVTVLTLLAFGTTNSEAEGSEGGQPSAGLAASQTESASDMPATEAVHQRARRGDPEALLELEHPNAPLGVPQLVALSVGRTAQRIRRLETLELSVREDPGLVNKAETVALLRGAIPDPRVAPYALQIVTQLPGPAAADILYEVWVGTTTKTDTTVLASELVYSPPVRSKASQALAVALDLRVAKECEDVQPLISRAIEHGDQRSLRLLGKLTHRRGCGANQQDDCFACIRGDNKLHHAILAVKNRPYKCTSPAWCAGDSICLGDSCPAP